ELVTHASVDGQHARQLHVILQPRADQALSIMPFEIGSRLRNLELLRHSREKVRHAAEAEASTGAALGGAVVTEMLPVDAGLQRMTAFHDEQLIGELIQVLREPLRGRAVRS